MTSAPQKVVNVCEAIDMDKLNEYYPIHQKVHKNNKLEASIQPSVDKENIKNVPNDDDFVTKKMYKSEANPKSVVKMPEGTDQINPKACLLQVPTALLQCMLKSAAINRHHHVRDSRAVATDALQEPQQKQVDCSKISKKTSFSKQQNNLQTEQQQQQPHSLLNQQQNKLHHLFELFQAQKAQQQLTTSITDQPTKQPLQLQKIRQMQQKGKQHPQQPLQQLQQLQPQQLQQQIQLQQQQMQQQQQQQQQQQLIQEQQQRRQRQQERYQSEDPEVAAAHLKQTIHPQRRRVSIESPMYIKKKQSEKVRSDGRSMLKPVALYNKQPNDQTEMILEHNKRDFDQASNHYRNISSPAETNFVQVNNCKPKNSENVKYSEMIKKKIAPFNKAPCHFVRSAIHSITPIKMNKLNNHVEGENDFEKTKRTISKFVKIKQKKNDSMEKIDREADKNLIHNRQLSAGDSNKIINTVRSEHAIKQCNASEQLLENEMKKFLTSSIKVNEKFIGAHCKTNAVLELNNSKTGMSVEEDDAMTDEMKNSEDDKADDSNDDSDEDSNDDSSGDSDDDEEDESKNKSSNSYNDNNVNERKSIKSHTSLNDSKKLENSVKMKNSLVTQFSEKTAPSVKLEVPIVSNKNERNCCQLQDMKQTITKSETSDDDNGDESSNSDADQTSGKVSPKQQRTGHRDSTVQTMKMNSSQIDEARKEDKPMESVQKSQHKMLKEVEKQQQRQLMQQQLKFNQATGYSIENQNSSKQIHTVVSRNLHENEKKDKQCHNHKELTSNDSKATIVNKKSHEKSSTKERSVTPDSTYAKLESIASTFINLDQTITSKTMDADLGDSDIEHTSKSEIKFNVTKKASKQVDSRESVENDKTSTLLTKVASSSHRTVNKSTKPSNSFSNKSGIANNSQFQIISNEKCMKPSKEIEKQMKETTSKTTIKLNFENAYEGSKLIALEQKHSNINKTSKDAGDTKVVKTKSKQLYSPASTTHSVECSRSIQEFKTKHNVIYAIPTVRYAKAHRTIESLNNVPTSIRIILSLTAGGTSSAQSSRKKNEDDSTLGTSTLTSAPSKKLNVTEEEILRKTFLLGNEHDDFRMRKKSELDKTATLHDKDNPKCSNGKSNSIQGKTIFMDEDEIKSDSKYLIEAKLAYLAQSKNQLKSSSSSYLKYFNDEVNRNFVDENLISSRCPAYNINDTYSESRSNYSYDRPYNNKSKYLGLDEEIQNKYLFKSLDERRSKVNPFLKTGHNLIPSLSDQSLNSPTDDGQYNYSNVIYRKNFQSQPFEFNKSKSVGEFQAKTEPDIYQTSSINQPYYNHESENFHSKSFPNTSIQNSLYRASPACQSYLNLSEQDQMLHQPYQQNAPSSVNRYVNNNYYQPHQLSQYNSEPQQLPINYWLQEHQYNQQQQQQQQLQAQNQQYQQLHDQPYPQLRNHQFQQQHLPQPMQSHSEFLASVELITKKGNNCTVNQYENFQKPFTIVAPHKEPLLSNNVHFKPQNSSLPKVVDSLMHSKQATNDVMNSNEVFSYLNHSAANKTRRNQSTISSYENNVRKNKNIHVVKSTQVPGNKFERFTPLTRKFVQNKMLKDCFGNNDTVTSFTIYKQKYNYQFPQEQAWYESK
ncbi:hypothetical protein HELRODRAFT_161437 [Helobdella robusta]|uniref:Uncharacterized protein n=1 Tax=Helobdella robusta TaxID=6412 RepID=T1ERH1_HELRO|nr:hypothetical protein HELRODRAFT_161437 [Helobdella robusta]ESO02196.1 hypothetical protein HELRODRAFT_161437 [Helobdella robusta]